MVLFGFALTTSTSLSNRGLANPVSFGKAKQKTDVFPVAFF